MGNYRKFKADENNDEILEELDTAIESEEGQERNPFALYEGEEYPETEKVTQEIKDVLDKFTLELAEMRQKWESYGIYDTQSRDAIIEYLKGNL